MTLANIYTPKACILRHLESIWISSFVATPKLSLHKGRSASQHGFGIVLYANSHVDAADLSVSCNHLIRFQ